MATCDAGNMHTEKQALLEFQENLPPRNSPNNEESPLRPSCSNHGVPKKPGKRPTRQWAAWTREEEECFFTALRQVGKNFEKITSRVQSKNKDQVRHYYYRLVRRMNKLLGPGFSLDAKNSKDTNAAMLRWWSLLEKYSCKASKLHLKPRRFKIFIEALEHQLIKDRKKNVRRRLPQGENCPSLCPTPSLQQNKPSINETHSVKFVLVDSQNIQKAGIGKGSTLRRNPNSGINKSSNKGDSSPTKASRQRRKTGGTLSAAAVKRWEKAAIAGVSLVADAAEHLERTSCGKEPETCGASAVHTSLQAEACAREENCLGPSNVVQLPLPRTSSNVPPESFTQNTGKLKLQLFPIDDGTKRALELDKHNPYLELTLSTRKKITSVMEHLSKKWGNCTVACGELMLFPYSAERENILKCERWTRESFVTAADVYAVIGSPSVFRLRYGWISASELHSATPSTFSGISLVDPTSPSGPGPWSNVLGTHNKDKEASSSHGNAVPQPMNDSPDEAAEYAGSDPENDILDLYGFGENIVCRRSLTGFGADKMGTGKNSAISAGEWADSLTNVSVGDLLTEVSDVEADCVEPPCTGSSPCHEEIPFTCDSFDAAIAAHILSHQNKMGFQSAATSSIWDAEETCDAFSFQSRSLNKEHAQSSSIRASSPYHADIIRTNSVGSDSFLKGLHEEEEMVDTAGQGDLMDEAGPSEPDLQKASSKDFNTLADMYWPESLGPLDLDAPSCRFYSQDMILSDSLGGLSRLIASSLDAFQNCSFFNIEKKETSLAATEAQAKASAFDNRTDDEV